MTEVASLAHSGQCAPPAGFIFHLSRCGSTLLAQMFASDATTIVLSEAPPLNRILRAHVEPQVRHHWFQDMVLALARKRNDQAMRAIVKCDSWHAQHIAFIERAFPGVPWVFLYRDPLEVLVSNLTFRSAQTLPGALDSLPEGVSLMDALQMPDEHFVALKIAQIMQSVLRHAEHPGALFVNYTDLPHAALPRILKHFGLNPDGNVRAAMAEKTQFNAKQPRVQFVADSAQKQAQASPLARHYAQTLLMPLYQQLEHLKWRANA
jgi:gluconate kinase